MLTGRFAGGRPEISCPSQSTWPEVGARKPAIMLSRVDLPAPEGPISAVNPALMRVSAVRWKSSW